MLKFCRLLNRKCLNTLKSTTQQRCYAAQRPGGSATQNKNLRSTLYYVTAGGVLIVGMSYAAVPLYRMFCQVSLKFLFK